MSTLYQINHDLEEALMRAIDPDTGEMLDEGAFDGLNELSMAREEKLLNIGKVVLSMNAEEAMIKAEEERLEVRRASIERRRKRLIEYTRMNMNTDEKISDPVVSLSFRKSQKLAIAPGVDLKKLPEGCFKVEETVKADAKEIKARIKKGENIQGCSLQTNYNLQIK